MLLRQVRQPPCRADDASGIDATPIVIARVAAQRCLSRSYCGRFAQAANACPQPLRSFDTEAKHEQINGEILNITKPLVVDSTGVRCTSRQADQVSDIKGTGGGAAETARGPQSETRSGDGQVQSQKDAGTAGEENEQFIPACARERSHLSRAGWRGCNAVRNLDVSFDYTTKGLQSDYGDNGGRWEMGWEPRLPAPSSGRARKASAQDNSISSGSWKPGSTFSATPEPEHDLEQQRPSTARCSHATAYRLCRPRLGRRQDRQDGNCTRLRLIQ